MTKSVGAATFKAKCLSLIDAMASDGEPIVVTKRGKPVAIVSPVSDQPRVSIIGAMKGSVLAYPDPFAPALDISEWNADL